MIKNDEPKIWITKNIVSLFLRMNSKTMTVTVAYTQMPIPWAIEAIMPDIRLKFILLWIIRAKLGPGDIAPSRHTIANWDQRKHVIDY
mgnify:CR=1 FL=1